MKYTINGSTVALNKDILSEESLNIMCKEIDSSYESCSKAIEAYNLVSNVKVMESFGYKATEGLGESIKNGAKAVWEKIKEFFKRISLFVNKLITDFIVKINFPFEKDKNEYGTDTDKKRFLDASKFLYDACVKILKKINSPDIYNNTEALKAYQKLEIYTGKLTKILRNGIGIVAKSDRYFKKLTKLVYSGKPTDNKSEYESKLNQFKNEWQDTIITFFISTCSECETLYQFCDLENYGDIFNRLSKQDKLDNLLEQSKNIIENLTLKITDVDSNDDEQKKTVNNNNNNNNNISKQSQERLKLVEDILYNNKDNPKTIEKQLIDLEKKYGKNSFDSYYSFKKKDQSDWNEKYLEELKMKIMSGILSKGLIIHLAEVQNYLQKKEVF